MTLFLENKIFHFCSAKAYFTWRWIIIYFPVLENIFNFHHVSPVPSFLLHDGRTTYGRFLPVWQKEYNQPKEKTALSDNNLATSALSWHAEHEAMARLCLILCAKFLKIPKHGTAGQLCFPELFINYSPAKRKNDWIRQRSIFPWHWVTRSLFWEVPDNLNAEKNKANAHTIP